MTAAAQISPSQANLAQPSHHELKVRRMDFEFEESQVPEWWFDQDPYKTLLLASLSGGFPAGERFFIDSVRQFRDRITDPVLHKAIGAFIGQEAHHSKEHEGLNALMEKRGYAIAKIDRNVAAAMDMYRKRLSPERQLAHTAAVEHFTALMSEHFLLDEDILDTIHPSMRTLWAWHAIEESEHKAVAFDVLKQVSDSEWIRISQMALASTLFLTFSTLDFILLMRQSGHMRDWKMWLNGVDYFWGRKGVFRKMVPAYLQYYRKDFHPWNHDSRALVKRIKERYLGDKA